MNSVSLIKKRLYLAVVIGAVSAIAVVMLHRPRGRVTGDDRRKDCLQDLRALGFQIAIYASENGNWFPDQLVRLEQGSFQIPPEILRCPDPDGEYYEYLGSGMRSSQAPSVPIAFCRRHGQQTVNVLFAGGHVTTLKRTRFEEEMRREALGTSQ